MTDDPRRLLPNMDLLLGHPELVERAASLGRGVVLGVARQALEVSRVAVAGGGPVPGVDELAARVAGELDELWAGRTGAVVNATGVVLHTNLGRAPLSAEARAAVAEAAGYAPVEYDLAAGIRGRRGAAAEALLREATGAEAALAVNNAAGALLLTLGGLARGREVVVSRGELIEIGGEFRLPLIMEAAGVVLREVGTTNRTHLRDYAAALGPDTGLVLAVHPSNYRVEGFTTRPGLAELANLAHEHGLALLHDVGSGLLAGALGDEPSVRASLGAGADLVLFSGDKLTVAALEATLATHLAGRRDELPVWRALLLTPDELRPRAAAVAAAIGPAASLRTGASVAGGGSLPGEGLESVLVEVDPAPAGAAAVLARLRAGDPPVVARAERGRVVLDLRTVPPEQDAPVARAVAAALGSPPAAAAAPSGP